MGVDYFPCFNCGETICDCGEFTICISCNNYFCEQCAIKLANDKMLENIQDESDECEECWYCTRNKALRKVSNEEFTEWLVKISDKTYNDYLNYLIQQGKLE